jgi:hypothetical protein
VAGRYTLNICGQSPGDLSKIPGAKTIPAAPAKPLAPLAPAPQAP